jgi:threonine-phosphate decarboxylase
MINGHGGDIYGIAQNLGCRPSDIVDMSSNVNPLGPMPELLTHLADHLDSVAYLPQVDAQSIRVAFAQYHGFDPGLLWAGNGSTQWIYTLPIALKARQALILAPTYADYADACAMHHIPVQYLQAFKENDFDFDLPKALDKFGQPDLVFICNPNNPTGRLIPSHVIETLCVSRPKTIFVIDESYLPFVPDSESYSLLKKTPPNVVIISSMSKIFCLPGLRIGLIKASREVIRCLSLYRLPWSVNGPATEAVLWLTQNKKIVDRFIDRSQQFIRKERDLFCDRLAKIPDLKYFKSCTSFVLIQLPQYRTSKEVWQVMANEKLLIRNCRNFHGLSERFIRISLKDRKSNQRAAEILAKACQK